MALFERKEKSVLEEFILKIKKLDGNYKDIIEYLEKISNKKLLSAFNDDALLCDIVLVVIRNYSDFQHYGSIELIINKIYKSYQMMIPGGINNQRYEMLLPIFINSLEHNSIFDQDLYKIFDNKEIYTHIMHLFDNQEDALQYFSVLKKYILENRKYFTNENAFLSDIIHLLEDIVIRDGALSVDEFINTRTIENQRMAGIYDSLNPESLQEIDDKLRSASSIIGKLNSTIALAGSQDEILRSRVENIGLELKNIADNLIANIKTEYGKVIEEFKTAYFHALRNEKELITQYGDEACRKLLFESEAILSEMRSITTDVSKNTKKELTRIHEEASSILKKLQEHIESEQMLSNIANRIPSSERMEALLAKIEKASGMVEKIEGARSGLTFVKDQSEISEKANSDLFGVPEIILPSNNYDAVKRNYYLDEKISFNERYERLWENMNRIAEQEGIVLHNDASLVARLVMEKVLLYLYGPSGSGKTFLINFILRVMGIETVRIDKFDDKFDLEGSKDGFGRYSPSPLYECWTQGKAFVIEELDQSSNAVAINPFYDYDEHYFPGVGLVKKNPNCLILSSGNTPGYNATITYRSRYPLDEAVQRRVRAIEFLYDGRVEERILQKYPSWCDFIHRFRVGTDSWIKENGYDVDAPGVLTTDTAKQIAKYLDNNSLTSDEIMRTEIIENKKLDYLRSIRDTISRSYSRLQRFDSNNIFDIFSSQIDNIKESSIR